LRLVVAVAGVDERNRSRDLAAGIARLDLFDDVLLVERRDVIEARRRLHHRLR
jgi:hypothetical protein